MMTIHVKMFAMIKDLAGADHVRLDVPDDFTVDRLCSDLTARYPGMAQWVPHIRFAVNSEYVTTAHRLHHEDEVAVIPPVSGG